MQSELYEKSAAAAIIVGAGKGLRMNSTIPKQYLRLNNLPVIVYSMEAFAACDKINEIYLVVSEAEAESFARNSFCPPLI